MEQIVQSAGINWLFIVVLVLLIIGVVRGFRQGFLRLVFSLVAGIVLIVAVSAATPYVGTFISNHTQLDEKLTEQFSTQVEAEAEGVLTGETDASDLATLGLAIPAILQSEITGSSDQSLVSELASGNSIGDIVGERIAQLVINGIAFVIVLVGGIIVLVCIGRLLRKVNDIPVLGKVNRGIGVVVGVFESLLLIWIVFAVISFLSITGIAAGAVELIGENVFLTFLYENNLVLAILSALI